MARVLVEFETAIAEVGAELQRPKSAALLGATCALPADFPVPVGVLRHTGPVPQHGQVIGYGIKLAGIPLGDAAFVEETLKRKGDKLELKFDQVTSKLEATHGWQLFSILRYCLRPTGDYFARLLFPSDAEPLMERIDDLVTATAQASFGQDISPEGPLGQRAAELLARQMRLPKRLDGAGLRSLEAPSSTAAFVAATLPGWARCPRWPTGVQVGICGPDLRHGSVLCSETTRSTMATRTAAWRPSSSTAAAQQRSSARHGSEEWSGRPQPRMTARSRRGRRGSGRSRWRDWLRNRSVC